MVSVLSARTSGQELKVLVSLDSEMAAASVVVRGKVTSVNLSKLYGILSRTNAFLPGMDLALDLTRARVSAGALKDLYATSAETSLPAAADPEGHLCRLRLLVAV